MSSGGREMTWDEFGQKIFTKEEIENSKRMAKLYSSICSQEKGRKRLAFKLLMEDVWRGVRGKIG